ncbi:MAG: tetratricopeptide repeat protein [Candidatus Omnitrophota bacterium]
MLTGVILEVGLRLGGFVLTSIQEHRNRISISRKGSYRIMCLGESTTAGQYPLHLEEILNQRNIGIKFSVIDKGLSGGRTNTILSLLEANLDAYHPDMVVTMMGINDTGKHMPYETFSDSKVNNFFKSCRTYKLARLLWLHLTIKLQEFKRHKALPAGAPEEEGGPSKEVLLEHDKMIQLGKTCRNQKNFFEIEKFCKDAIEIDPQNIRAYILQGTCYREQGKFSEAEAAYGKAIALDSQDDKAYIEFGGSCRKQGRFTEAEELYKKAITLNPEGDNIYIELGDTYRKHGKYSQAAEAFKTALEINPKNRQAYFELGNFYRKLGQYSETDEPSPRAQGLKPKSCKEQATLGKPYQQQERYSEALELLQRHIMFYPQSDRAYGAVESVYRDMGNSRLAEKYSDKARKLRLGFYDPSTATHYHKLREILRKRGVSYVCVQYPMRDLESLKKVFRGDTEGIIFVDNEKIFKDAVRKESYAAYFGDMFGGDFGHCTEKGNRLLAENIANTILREAFNK